MHTKQYIVYNGVCPSNCNRLKLSIHLCWLFHWLTVNSKLEMFLRRLFFCFFPFLHFRQKFCKHFDHFDYYIFEWISVTRNMYAAQFMRFDVNRNSSSITFHCMKSSGYMNTHCTHSANTLHRTFDNSNLFNAQAYDSIDGWWLIAVVVLCKQISQSKQSVEKKTQQKVRALHWIFARVKIKKIEGPAIHSQYTMYTCKRV